jgi:PIN domain nuclease of toxin-antitoxin system
LSEEIEVQGCLLDTHAALFSMFQSKALSAPAKAAIASGRNFLSVVSYWEVMIKSMKGTLDVGDPRQWWNEALEQLAATVLPLRPGHIAAIHGLPPIHKDPFDRVLIAQATVEGLTLVSRDSSVARYASGTLRVIK